MTKEGGGEEEEARAPLSFDGNGHHSTNNTTTTGAKAINGHCRLARLLAALSSPTLAVHFRRCRRPRSCSSCARRPAIKVPFAPIM